jgi:chromosome segregation ATPase
MPEPSAKQKVNGHIAVSSAFLLVALAGWGGFAYSARSAAEQRSEFGAQVQRLKAEQNELRSERDRLLAEHRDGAAKDAELEYLRKRVAEAEADGRVVGDERDRARAELSAATQEIAALQERLTQSEAEPPSATGTTRSVRRRGFRGQRSRTR